MEGRILERTSHFLHLYLHHCGESEIPKVYNVWSCFSLVAAAVGDKVFLYKRKGKKLHPNLYTILLGPSGLGKGTAIDIATKFLKPHKKVGYYEGRITGARMVDVLAQRSRSGSGARMLLVTPELLTSVGTGSLAEDFVMKMTHWYEGFEETTDGTRGSRDKKMVNLLINWLAGTTQEWMLKALTRDAIEGGFLGRCVTVEATYQPDDERFRRPLYPDDYDEVLEHLHARVRALTYTAGEFVLTPDAEAAEESWYMERPRPTDPALWPTWKREHDFMLKIAMLLSLMDGGDLILTESHILTAQRLSAQAQKSVPALAQAAQVTRDTESIDAVRRFLKYKKTATRLEVVSSLGVRFERRRLMQALAYVAEVGDVVTTRGLRNEPIYGWVGRKA